MLKFGESCTVNKKAQLLSISNVFTLQKCQVIFDCSLPCNAWYFSQHQFFIFFSSSTECDILKVSNDEWAPTFKMATLSSANWEIIKIWPTRLLLRYYRFITKLSIPKHKCLVSNMFSHKIYLLLMSSQFVTIILNAFKLQKNIINYILLSVQFCTLRNKNTSGIWAKWGYYMYETEW